MWGDVLNKPKQGTPYQIFRDELMNAPEVYDDEKERLNTHPDLLDNAKETLDCNHPIHDFTDKLMEARSKTHNHQPSHECVVQITNW